jgi:hypothetical protein
MQFLQKQLHRWFSVIFTFNAFVLIKFWYTKRSILCEIWGSRGGEDDDVALLGNDAVWTGR